MNKLEVRARHKLLGVILFFLLLTTACYPVGFQKVMSEARATEMLQYDVMKKEWLELTNNFTLEELLFKAGDLPEAYQPGKVDDEYGYAFYKGPLPSYYLGQEILLENKKVGSIDVFLYIDQSDARKMFDSLLSDVTTPVTDRSTEDFRLVIYSYKNDADKDLAAPSYAVFSHSIAAGQIMITGEHGEELVQSLAMKVIDRIFQQ